MAEWQEVGIAEIAAPTSNALATGPFGSSISSVHFRDSGIPVLRGGNLSSDSEIRLRDEGLVFLAPEKAAEFSKSTVRAGDLVFTCWGTVDQVGLIDDSAQHDRYVISNKQMKATVDSRRADSEFLYYLFSGDELQRRILGQSIGSSIPGFNLGQLKALRFRLPPLGEQRAIAAALTEVDDLGAALDALIEKKRAIKTATMQRLLTGRQRLAGFSGEWEIVRLGEIGTFSKGRGIRRSDVQSSGLPCVRYGELYTAHTDIIREFVSFISPEVAAVAQPLRPGDILFAGSGETKEEIGISAAYVGAEEAYAGGDIVILSPWRQDSGFLGYLLNSPTVQSQKASFAQGDAVVHISARNLAKIVVDLPSLDEQRAIASILNDMDAELAALAARREKTRQIKRGLMQELLTGRTRLV
ncbi:MAG: restriction endonuclease subunit S [Bacteroidota bacterium]